LLDSGLARIVTVAGPAAAPPAAAASPGGSQ
jgi:hypothetical protein